MSVPNLTTSSSANFQLFSKALQDAVPSRPPTQQSPRANASGGTIGDGTDQQAQTHQLSQLSTADLHQLMLSQLDQQLYLSQLSGLGSDPSCSVPNRVHSFASGPLASSASSTDSAAPTTTTSSCSNAVTDPLDLLGQHLTHQKLMEQFLEVATTAASTNGGQQNGGGGTTPGGTEEMVSQLMAQLVNGSSAGNGAGQMQQQMGGPGQGQQQQRTAEGAASQSPSSALHHQQQQQMSLSLLEQLQLLQMLGSSGALPSSIAGLSELFTSSAGSSAHAEGLAQLLKGGVASGGSPSKAEQVYCDLCDKWLCNRYFLKTHMLKKHGIGDMTSNTNSPLKNGVGNFSFGSGGHQLAAGDDPGTGRPQSASLQHPQISTAETAQRESPSAGTRLVPKLSLSSTPGIGNPTAFNDALSPDHQQMAMMQQLAAQLGLTSNASTDGGRNALLEQILTGGALPLAELMSQTHQEHGELQRTSSPVPSRASPSMPSLSGDAHHHSSASASSSAFPCSHCAKVFGSQSALFQHQLTEHIGTDLQQHQQNQNNNDAQSSINALAMMSAGMGGAGGGAPNAQQQQLFGHLLGSNPFPQGTAPSMMFTNASFGGMNQAEFDGTAMLAKLSAELAAAAQGQQPGGAVQTTQSGQMQTPVQGQMTQATNKPPPQKRQYSSTSKNFCDLCNKEVCNKYFLRTHMLKMHNIIIDENKPLIANIDTVEKERKGEVKFRCDICHASMGTREELRSHKREMHGMQPAGPLHTPPGAKGQKASTGSATMDTANVPQQKLSTSLPPFAPHFGETRRDTFDRQWTGTGTPGPTEEEANPLGAEGQQNPVKQLLSIIGAEQSSRVARLPPTTNSIIKKELMLDGQEGAEQSGEPKGSGEGVTALADANNNATSCRFCGLYLEDETQLQLHQLMEHPVEYMAMLQATGTTTVTTEEDKLVNQVAMQMVEANSQHHLQQQQQLRKTSAASSGATSSSSGAGFSGEIPHPAVEQQRYKCPQCKRNYKSAQKMEYHQRTVHHNFVAKLSPTKRTILSPKKKAKLLTSFSCPKCRRRFGTRAECDDHVISHIRMEQKQVEGEEEGRRAKRARIGEEKEAEGGRLMVDEAEEEEAEQGGSVGGAEKGRMMMNGREEEEEQMRRRTKGATDPQKIGRTKEGEKHSHTSGSTSPISVQAGSSGSGLPEGFAHPLLDHPKPFVLQSFTLRTVSPHAPSGLHQSLLPDELIAYLPVRSTLGEPIRVTFELSPSPQIDQQVQHL